MGHNRKLAISGIALTMARNNRFALDVINELRDELERIVIDTGYLDDAPFQWVGLILRFGLVNEEKPHYQRIDNKYGDWPSRLNWTRTNCGTPRART